MISFIFVMHMDCVLYVVQTVFCIYMYISDSQRVGQHADIHCHNTAFNADITFLVNKEIRSVASTYLYSWTMTRTEPSTEAQNFHDVIGPKNIQLWSQKHTNFPVLNQLPSSFSEVSWLYLS
jgi:hypothetical protein